MRTIAIVVVLVGLSTEAAAQRRIDVPDRGEGWCRREVPIAPAASERTTFQVDLVRGRVRPVRDRVEASMFVEYPRNERSRGWDDYAPSMDQRGTLTIIDVGTCRHTNAGCIHPWSQGRVVRRETFGAGACIAFWEELGGGAVLGIERGGRQMLRMYPDVEEGAEPSRTVPSPGLEPLATIAGVLILGETRAGAPLWTVRWSSGALVLAPSRAVSTGRVERIVTSLGAGDPPLVVLGDAALGGLDRRTLARRWQVPADPWSVIFASDEIVALSLERPERDRARVHLLVLDEQGRVLRDHVVHEGAAVRELRMSAVDPRTYVVHVGR